MNPYLAPTSGTSNPPAGGFGTAGDVIAPEGRAGVSDATIETMRQTKPWVMLMGVFTLIGSALMVLMALMMMGMSAVLPHNGPVPPMLLGFIYLPMAAVYVYPGIKLWHYGSAIGRLMMSRSVSDLETALAQQKSFWKFVGILMLVMIGLYGLIFVIALIGGIVGASRAH